MANKAVFVSDLTSFGEVTKFTNSTVGETIKEKLNIENVTLAIDGDVKRKMAH